MTYIPEDRLPGLRQYRYGGVDKSLVSRYILAPYWNALVKIFPLSVAPNLITLMGLSCIIANVATLFYFSPDLGECPQWVYYTFAAGLFIYQSLDAIDGKQARRTGTSGPLGELFDHCCDALNTTLGTLTWASATYLGQSWWTVASLCASLANFYVSTWEEYHTGVLYLGYFSGPVEGVLMLVGVHFISGVFGPAFWTLTGVEVFPMIDWSTNAVARFFGGMQLNHVLIVIGGFVTISNTLMAIVNVLCVKFWPTELSRKDQPVWKALAGLFPFINLCIWSAKWMSVWPDIVTDHLALFMLILGLLFAHQVGIMILAHVTHLEFPLVDVPVTLIISSGYFLASYEDTISQYMVVDHQRVLILYLMFAATQYIHFVSNVVDEICTYLDIGCLYIKHPKAPTPEQDPQSTQQHTLTQAASSSSSLEKSKENEPKSQKSQKSKKVK